MNLKILKRRAEMLNAVSTGLHPSVVIAQLAEKYGVSVRCLLSDLSCVGLTGNWKLKESFNLKGDGERGCGF